MKPTASRSIAAASAVALCAAALDAARRPSYGGELRVETRAALHSLDPAAATDDPLALQLKEQIIPAIFDTLVRLDDRGNPQPALAMSWTHDAARKRWFFSPRANVLLHNGAPWTPASESLEFPDERPIEQILRELARPQNAVVVRADDGTLIGTGPYRVAQFTPDKELRLEANDTYWSGRPFLDAIQIQMGRALRDQELDFDLKKTDIADIAVTDQRRWRQKGATVSLSAPSSVIALVFENARIPDAARETLALSIDRASINSVLLQSQGEISGALLPRRLSGYSFLFPAERNLARARQLAAGAQALAFSYDRQDPLLRPVGERIAVNAMEAGIVLRASPGAPDVRLVQLPITSPDPWNSLASLVALLKSPVPPSPANPYELERPLLEAYRVIPLMHLPQAWSFGSQVKAGTAQNGLAWASIWLDRGANSGKAKQ